MRHGEFAVVGTASNGEKTVQIVHRIACVLRAFGNQGLLGITDLANTTGLPKSTTHRLVTALVNEGLFLTALLVVHDNTHREQAVRAVFAAVGLAPIRDEAVNGWSVRVLRYPLPAGASNIEELISDLLRKGYGLAENVRLEFAFWEDENS